MKEKVNIANIVTASRIVFAMLLFACTELSITFYVLYLFGAFTDMIDGTIARKLNLKSVFGAKLDTVADFIFVIAVLIKILPTVFMPRWLSIWVIVIITVKITNLLSSIIMFHRIVPMHTVMNKITGMLLFILPFGIGHGTRQTLAFVVIVTCLIATFAAIQEGHYIRTGREFEY